MLDLTGILFSSIMILLVIVRAVQLDRTQPWFQRVKCQAAVPRQWQRRN